MLTDTYGRPAPDVVEGRHGTVQVGRGDAQHRPCDHRGQAYLHGLEVLTPYPNRAESEAGDEISPVLPSGGVVHEQRAGAELQNQGHRRVRDRAVADRRHATVTKPRHADAAQLAGPRRACDVPHSRIVLLTHGGSHHLMLRRVRPTGTFVQATGTRVRRQ